MKRYYVRYETMERDVSVITEHAVHLDLDSTLELIPQIMVALELVEEAPYVTALQVCHDEDSDLTINAYHFC